jgi:hypothetical protein
LGFLDIRRYGHIHHDLRLPNSGRSMEREKGNTASAGGSGLYRDSGKLMPDFKEYLSKRRITSSRSGDFTREARDDPAMTNIRQL